MRRFILVTLALCCAAPIFADDFQPSFLQETKGMPAYNLKNLKPLIEGKKWTELSHDVKAFARRGMKIQELLPLASLYAGTPFASAVYGSKNILKMDGTGLNLATIFPILLFYHTTLSDEILQGKTFWSEGRFERELQYDPETKLFFIHLGIKEVKPLGIGAYKVVSKTLSYNGLTATMYARGTAPRSTEKEMAAMKALKDSYGVIPLVAAMIHKNPKTKKKVWTIVTPIFNAGSIQSHFEKHTKFSLNERIQIAFDITLGLANIHGKGYVHRDLGARNYFVNISRKGNKRIVKAVVADLGRTILYDNAIYPPVQEGKKPKVIKPIYIKGVPVQGNKTYLSPEGLLRNKMIGPMYIQSDTFAEGTVLYILDFGKDAPWKREGVFFLDQFSLNQRKEILEAWVQKGLSNIQIKTDHVSNARRKAFLGIIAKMVDPNPASRISAKKAAMLLSGILGPQQGARELERQKQLVLLAADIAAAKAAAKKNKKK